MSEPVQNPDELSTLLPMQALLQKRRVASFLASILSLTFCLLVFGGSSTSPAISPGRLSSAHSAMKDDCAQCHTAAEGGFSNWVSHAFDSKTSLADSQRCLKCHPEISTHALSPHGMCPQDLFQLTANAQQKTKLSLSDSDKQSFLQTLAEMTAHKNQDRSLTCSTCHREHHGQKTDLTDLTNQQCQSCHARQFESFAHGHPEFTDFPHERRSRIYFDHAKHLMQYFADEKFAHLLPAGTSATSCTACHQQDSSGRFMVTGGFQQMCANCHTSEITDKVYPGIAFFALPNFSQTESSKVDSVQSEILIGEWPATDGTNNLHALPPFMEMLLADDKLFQHAKQTLGDDAPRRLNYASQKHPAAVEQYLWSIKQLIDEIAQDGEAALERRLGPSYSAVAHMKPSIVESVISMQRVWFPNLMSEVSTQRHGKPPAQSLQVNSLETYRGISAAEHTSGGGWYLSKTDFSIRYRPQGHADRLIKSWIELQARTVPNTDLKPTGIRKQALAKMFQILESPTGSGTVATRGPVSSGRCLKCHTADDPTRNGQLKINWLAFRPTDDNKTLHKFTHAPHLKSRKSETCSSCHILDRNFTSVGTFYRPEFFLRDSENRWAINTNPASAHASGFSRITKANCVNCHNESAVRQSCLTCHNYHSCQSGSN